MTRSNKLRFGKRQRSILVCRQGVPDLAPRSFGFRLPRPKPFKGPAASFKRQLRDTCKGPVTLPQGPWEKDDEGHGMGDG